MAAHDLSPPAPAPPPPSTAVATAAAPPARIPNMPPSYEAPIVISADNLARGLAFNTDRMAKATECLNACLKGNIPFNSAYFAQLLYALARAIDYVVSCNVVPNEAQFLPSVIKKAYQQYSSSGLQSAIMVLMISAKGACRNQWFNATDADELLRLANELFNKFCSTVNGTLGVSNALEVISKVMPRFYPRLKLCRLVLSLDVKPGYDVLMSDFHIPRDIPAGERMQLLVIQTNNLETSSCIVSPPQVSFLVNGKGVARRTSVSADNGPQFPTDISRMLKYGTNIFQAVGYFGGNYIIAIAFMSLSISTAPVLEDYVQPVDGASPDLELIVDASRISLNCPISFRRIKTPVKGHHCKHYQSFDYDNFIEMNSIKPSWRCPCCNQPVSCVDLRIDQKIVKILEEVGEDVVDIVISTDGSWKAVAEHREIMEKSCNEACKKDRDTVAECDFGTFMDIQLEILDLTMEPASEDNPADLAKLACDEIENRKPVSGLPSESPGNLQDSCLATIPSTSFENYYSIMTVSSNARGSGTLESVVPNRVLSAVLTDAVSPALGRETSAIIGASPVGQQASQVTRLAESTQLPRTSQQVAEFLQLEESIQLHHPRPGASILNERPSIPRNVNYTPIAVQALPASKTNLGSSHGMRTSVVSPSFVIHSDLANSYQSVGTVMVPSSGISTGRGHVEMQQYSRMPDVLHLHSMAQNQQQVVASPASNPIGGASLGQQRGAGNAERGASAAGEYSQHLLTAAQWASMVPRPRPYAGSPQLRTPGPATSHLGDIPRMPSYCQEQLNVTQASKVAARPDGAEASKVGARPDGAAPEAGTSETNWQATGRMRGSLSAQEKSAALSQYFPAYAQPTTAAAPRPPPPASDHLPQQPNQ